METLQKYKKEKYPFEEYLQYIHSLDYLGTDDNMPDAFNDWLGDLEEEDYIEHGNVFAKMLLEQIK